MRLKAILFIAALALLGIVAAIGYRNARADPIVRHLDVRLADYPPGAAPVRIVLFADVHVHGPDMPPARVGRLVDQINALRPDIIVAAGDFVGNNWIGADYPVTEAIAPLARLKARLGNFAVLGNNDHVAGVAAVTRALNSAHFRVLNNEAVTAGPIALGGLDDRKDKTFKQVRKNEQATYSAMLRTPGARVLIAHTPDYFPTVPPSIALMLVGHTHCGQIALPLVGPIITGSDYGRKYACGLYRRGDETLVVTGGLGTSHLPLRLGAPPDVWVIDVSGRPAG